MEPRPILTIEKRAFCLRRAWSAPADGRAGDVLGDHMYGHGVSVPRKGVDWAWGRRYGPLTGTRRRGRPKTLPPLRTRSQAGAQQHHTSWGMPRRGAVMTRRGKKSAGAAVEPG